MARCDMESVRDFGEHGRLMHAPGFRAKTLPAYHFMWMADMPMSQHERA
jgi:hypothetical protein